MTDTTTTAPAAAPAEVSVASVAAHMASVSASAQAHIALINSQPTLYPGGLPVSLANMAKQVAFLNAQVVAATPAAPAAGS